MDIDKYMERVIFLFRVSEPTQEQWEEMAKAVLEYSEDGRTPLIDESITKYEHKEPKP